MVWRTLGRVIAVAVPGGALLASWLVYQIAQRRGRARHARRQPARAVRRGRRVARLGQLPPARRHHLRQPDSVSPRRLEPDADPSRPGRRHLPRQGTARPRQASDPQDQVRASASHRHPVGRRPVERRRHPRAGPPGRAHPDHGDRAGGGRASNWPRRAGRPPSASRFAASRRRCRTARSRRSSSRAAATPARSVPSPSRATGTGSPSASTPPSTSTRSRSALPCSAN